MGKPQKKKYAVERNYEPVGEYLKTKRLQSGLMQKDVAEALDTSVQLISNYESGFAVPPLKKLAALVKLFKLNPDELLDVILEVERDVMMRGISKTTRLRRAK